MYLTMIIGILLLGAIAGGYSLYDDWRSRKEKALRQEQERAIKEQTLRVYQGEGRADDRYPAPDGAEAEKPEEQRGLRLADLVEYALKSGEDPFVQHMRFAGRNGDWNVIAVDSDDNIYIIETEKKPGYEDMTRQIREDVAHYRSRMQKNADERMTYVIVCTNEPDKPVRRAAYEDRSIRIYRYSLQFRPYRV